MTRTPAERPPNPGRPDGTPPAPAPADGTEPAHDPEVIQLAARAFDLARRGTTDTLAAYVDAGVPPDLADDRGRTLLLLAAYHGHAATVAALLERGADPDRPDDTGRTPLAGAVLRGADEAVTALLAAGADPAAGTPSALEAARDSGREDLAARFGNH